MRCCVLFFAVVLSGCIATTPVSGAVYIDTTQDMLNATMAIVNDSNRVFCSAVRHNGMLLTAAHCVDQYGFDEYVSAVFPADWDEEKDKPRDGGRVYRFGIIYADEAEDLAILMPIQPLPNTAEVELYMQEPAYGQDIRVIGHPYGFTWTITTGIITHPSRYNDPTVRSIQFDAAISPGNSGGPVLTPKGELVAIVTLRLEGHGFGVHNSVIIQALESLRP